MNNYFTNEQSVLGSLVVLQDLTSDVAQKVMAMLSPASFQDMRHSTIYKAITQLEAQGGKVDLILLDNLLSRNGFSEQTGGIAYLAEIQQSTPSSANIVAYADAVRQNAIKSTINGKMQAFLAEFNDLDGKDVYKKLGALESEINGLTSRAVVGRENGLTHIKEIGKQWVNKIQEIQEDPSSHIGIKTGFESLDDLIGPQGIVDGSLFVIGARPKMGKSALLEAITKNCAINENKTALVFSLELPNLQIFERYLKSESKVQTGKYYTQGLTEAEWATTSSGVQALTNSEIYIDDTAGVDVHHIKRESRKAAKHSDIGIIAVDYLTLMKAEKADRNDLAYGEITKQLKNLAKELNCVVLLLTQLNRGLESRMDKRPMPSDSKDTGQIEQDCDYWVGMYRDSVYDENITGVAEGHTELILRLNRHGKTGTAFSMLKHGALYPCEPFAIHKETTAQKKDF